MNSLFDDIAHGRRMSSSEFIMFEHCSKQGDSPLELWDFAKSVPLNNWKYIGWCPSSSTCIPNSNWGGDYPIAVLLENDIGERVWCHVKATDEILTLAFNR